MAQRIKLGDTVKIVSGADKGTTGKVTQVLPKANAVRIENVGTRSRKLKPSQLNPTGGTRDLHVPVSLHKVALVVDEKTSATSRVGFSSAKDGKQRIARQLKNKEIK